MQEAEYDPRGPLQRVPRTVTLIVKIVSTSQGNLNALREQGLQVERANHELGIVQGWLETRDAPRIAEFPFVISIRPVARGRLRAGGAMRPGPAAVGSDPERIP